MNEHSPNLNIALLTYLGQPHTGGFGVYVRYLSRALVERGHRVDVFSGPPYPDLHEDVNLIRLPRLDLYGDRPHWSLLRPKHLLSWTDFREWLGGVTGGFPLPYTFGRRVTSRLRDRDVDYDVVHDNAGHFSGLLELMDEGYPVVSTIHHPNTIDRRMALEHTDGLLGRLIVRRWFSFVRMQKTVIRRLPALITVSQQAREDIAREYAVDTDRVFVVPNGIDTGLYRPREDVGREPGRLMAVSSAGWLRANKGFKVLARAFRSLVLEDGRDLHLVVIGSDGGEESGVDFFLMKLEIADRVIFLQDLSFDQMARQYARASILVVPSLYEGFGLPAAEAMACGTPVVASRAGGLPEVVGDAGVLVPPGDPGALAEGIGELLEDPERRRRLGRRGRERVEERFTWSRAARRTEIAYRRAMEG